MAAHFPNRTSDSGYPNGADVGLVVGSIGLLEVSESQGRSDTASLYRTEGDCTAA
jgi:hypothetical protein